MLTQKFLNAFISLLVIANPLGVATVFVGLMSHCTASEIRAVATKAAGVAFGVLLFFAFFGEPLLRELGIRLPSFHVAGGILLFTIAFRMIFGDARFGGASADQNTYADRSDIAVFPLAIPLIAGPGCMTVMILLMSRTDGVVEEGSIVLALALVMGLTFVCLLAARNLLRVVGVSGNVIISRIMGMLLAARSVQFIVDGLRDMHGLFFS
ncbi:MAG: MarC family protein [Alphaproteobacteria bacterium]|nr:MarC family protein [Alphaproteobacteria bacterium]